MAEESGPHSGQTNCTPSFAISGGISKENFAPHEHWIFIRSRLGSPIQLMVLGSITQFLGSNQSKMAPVPGRIPHGHRRTAGYHLICGGYFPEAYPCWKTSVDRWFWRVHRPVDRSLTL